MISVLKPGLFTTVQDLGRRGCQQYGIVVGGALDRFGARIGNLLAGNDETAAVLEMAQTGPELSFDRDTLVAWNGADFPARVGREALPRDRAVRVAAGEVVSFGVARSGLRAWLAVAGGIDVPLVLGSRSTYYRAGLGGHRGRALAAGDELPQGTPSDWAQRVQTALAAGPRRATSWTVRPETMGKPAPVGVVRVMRGPEWDWFDRATQLEFLRQDWRATREADRMGVRLDGPALLLAKPHEMISSPVNAGVVQVPPSGKPIVLLPSRQSVGGYPRLAVVASVDLRRLAQLGPGDSVRFDEITVAAAQAIYLARERDFNLVQSGLARLAP